MKTVPGLTFSVSYTTRAPRGHELEGANYHFISREEFEKRVALGEFLEYAEVFGNFRDRFGGFEFAQMIDRIDSQIRRFAPQLAKKKVLILSQTFRGWNLN